MPLLAATVFLSAALLFLVQPIVAKQVVPWFGGAAAVWTTCLVFFQVALLAGYAYAHLIATRLPPARQTGVHATLLLASLLALPIVPSPALQPAGDAEAAWSLLAVLAATVGLPYVLLAATGPLLQRWTAHRFTGRTVYRLFALSNLGSLLGLLAYPFAIEPRWPAPTQAWAWSAAYAGFVAACIAVGWRASRGPAAAAPAPAAESVPEPAATPPLTDRALWFALAALGAALLVGASQHLSQNIASVPFMWVVPLALYLLSFVLAFELRGGRGLYDPRWGVPLAVAAAVAMAAGLSAQLGVLDLGIAVPLYAGGLFLTCLFCHGEIARRRPAPRHLTAYYLAIAAGGAAGGLAAGLLAPLALPGPYELPAALAAVCAAAVVCAPATAAAGRAGGSRRARSGAWLLAGVGVAGTALCVQLGWAYRAFLARDTIEMSRNFYGVLRVRERGAGSARHRQLVHGVILHGAQPLEGPRPRAPGSYYAPSSGVGLAIAARRAAAAGAPLQLGVVGLGAGTLAAYGRPGDTLRFYEIDPAVVEVARSRFDYLGDTPARVEIVLGDARLSLARERAEPGRPRFDVLAVDAFSSDAIPVHLITREAISLYAQHLAEGGLLAVHVSNRFLDLRPVLANVAQQAGLHAWLVRDDPPDLVHDAATDWVLLARRPRDLEPDAELVLRARSLDPSPWLSVWTDHHNNLFEVLRLQPRAALRQWLDPS